MLFGNCIFICVYVCTLARVYFVYVHVCVCLCICMFVEARGQTQGPFTPRVLSILFFPFSFFLSTSVCMHLHACEHMYVCTCACVYSYVGRSKADVCLTLHFIKAIPLAEPGACRSG